MLGTYCTQPGAMEENRDLALVLGYISSWLKSLLWLTCGQFPVVFPLVAKLMGLVPVVPGGAIFLWNLVVISSSHVRAGVAMWILCCGEQIPKFLGKYVLFLRNWCQTRCRVATVFALIRCRRTGRCGATRLGALCGRV